MLIRLPQTIYCVALVYTGPDGIHRVFSRPHSASGVNPLTEEEAVARADRELRAEWRADRFGPAEVWRLAASAVSYVTQEA